MFKCSSVQVFEYSNDRGTLFARALMPATQYTDYCALSTGYERALQEGNQPHRDRTSPRIQIRMAARVFSIMRDLRGGRATPRHH